ncbi:unnamed protein product [Effrenium voratum]|nr:unnamed protein product [Effrenium voratum]
MATSQGSSQVVQSAYRLPSFYASTAMCFRFLLVLLGLCSALRQSQVTKDAEAAKEWWHCRCDGKHVTSFTTESECDWRCRARCPDSKWMSCHVEVASYVSDSDEDDY